MGALTGIVVLDLSLLFPGPYCTSLLHSMGAEVIRIERPGSGDYLRYGPDIFASLNWGKKSLTLGLGSEEGKAIFRQLAERADVIVEGFRPGAMARLGLDYDSVRAINPRIVYCSISGFGQESPYRDKPAHDANIEGISGALSHYARPGDSNSGLALPLADLSSGLFAAFGVLGALLERDRTGRGKFVDISMTDGLFSWVAIIESWGYPGSNLGPMPGRGSPHYGHYEARDGKLLVLGLTYENHLWKNLCTALGLSQWLELDYSARLKAREEINVELRRVFRQKDRDEWLEAFKSTDVPVTSVSTVEEALRDPHVIFRRLVSQLQVPGDRTLSVVRNPVLPPTSEIAGGAPPALGRHTVEVLEGLGYGREEIEQLRAKGVIA